MLTASILIEIKMIKNPTKMRMSHILLSWDGAVGSTHTRELAFALKEADMLLTELKKGTMTWKQCVTGHSACLETPFGTGDLGWREQHEITPELWRVCSILEVGELCPTPVHTLYGIHIIMRTG